MMWWGGDWGWLVGVLFVVFCMVMMGRMMMGRMSGRSHSGHGGSRPPVREILAQRFARGEISEEEFEQRNRVLDRPTFVEREVRSGSPGAP